MIVILCKQLCKNMLVWLYMRVVRIMKWCRGVMLYFSAIVAIAEGYERIKIILKWIHIYNMPTLPVYYSRLNIEINAQCDHQNA